MYKINKNGYKHIYNILAKRKFTIMDLKTKQLDKERYKALGDLLILECKSANYSLETIDTLIENGADLSYNNSKALYFATKQLKFELIKYLINNGALKDPIAKTYISNMCEYKGFNDAVEKQFFEILDIAHSKTGDYMMLFTPYINNMAVNGRLDKLRNLMKRYYLTESEIVSVIYIRIIFEIIKHGYLDILTLIEKHNDFKDQGSLDLCVSTGEAHVLEYLLFNSKFTTPSDDAVAKAIYEGYFNVLIMLELNGYDFSKKSIFLEKACRAVNSKGAGSIEFLLERGYSLTDSYKGKTILEHAIEDKNSPLQEYLSLKIS